MLFELAEQADLKVNREYAGHFAHSNWFLVSFLENTKQ